MSDRPNVLMICTDHWGGHLMRPAGHPTVMTPTIAQFARCGVRFTNAYSTEPVCIPARRSLMTGQTARSHGERCFDETAEMPDVPTLAQCFRDAGYQAHCVGKLHVYPPRDRIGFDDVILNEEGRHHLEHMQADDWELFLADRGFAGQEYASGMNNNDYMTRPWHLPEDCHPTNWAAREMCRMIRRRDPRKPGFWYLSFVGPHQPVWPLACYMDQYRDVEMDDIVMGDWARDFDALPWSLKFRMSRFSTFDAPPHEIDLARRAFYATITHIDHQIRVVIGMLREQGLLNNTIIVFTADHGDMLGDHGYWTKGVFYEKSAKVPMIVVPTQGDDRMPANTTDDRLVTLRDVMPTLLDLAGIKQPSTVEGLPMHGDTKRDHLYGEVFEGHMASRMIRKGKYKLIYYGCGNTTQLFDLDADPWEAHDLSNDPAHAATCDELTQLLIGELYGEDEAWLEDGELVGIPDLPFANVGERGLVGQRGIRFM